MLDEVVDVDVDEEVVVEVGGAVVEAGAVDVVGATVEAVVSAEPPPQEAAIRATTRTNLRIYDECREAR